MKRFFVALALGGLVAVAPSVNAQTRGLGNVNGTVEAETGGVVAGADVKIMLAGGASIDGKTDASGKWSLNGIGKGEFQVEFTKDGFVTKRVKLVVEKEALRTAPVKIVMKKS